MPRVCMDEAWTLKCLFAHEIYIFSILVVRFDGFLSFFLVFKCNDRLFKACYFFYFFLVMVIHKYHFCCIRYLSLPIG